MKIKPARFRLQELLAGRTRYWLAKAAGVDYETLSAMYHNRGKGISLEVLAKVARALEVEPGDLFEKTKG